MHDATTSPLKKGEIMVDDILMKNVSEPLNTSEEALGISLIKRKKFQSQQSGNSQIKFKNKRGQPITLIQLCNSRKKDKAVTARTKRRRVSLMRSVRCLVRSTQTC